MKAYGIDLGTTYSCIAKADAQGNVEVIKNIEGKNITPSVVQFISQTEVVVGETAKGEAILDPDNVAQYIKRFMGKQEDTFEYHGKVYTPEQISAFILKKLVEDADAATGEKIKDVVITVPAYFGFDERHATENAGKIAGLNVLSIVNEPTAAAIAYGNNKTKEDKVVLVYDLGGGTFDVTVAEIVGDKVTVICTEGNHTLGGKDWDAELISYFVAQFCEKTGVEEDEIYEDSEVRNELALKAEEAKKNLTSKPSASFSLSLGRGKRAKLEVTREKFDEITRHHLLSTIELTKTVIKQAATKTSSKGKTCDNFDEIIFVGGSTRMRQVEEVVKKEFGVEPRIFDPDEAIARGAALLAQELKTEQKALGALGTKSVKGGLGQARLGEVTSKSYGARAIVNGESKLYNFILKNEPIPTTKTDTLGTLVRNQPTMEVAIFESNLMEEVVELSFGNPLWERHPNSSLKDDPNIPYLELPPGLPEGAPVEITFSLDLNGLLEITAIEKKSGRKCNFAIKTKGLSNEDVVELRKQTSAVKVTDAEDSVAPSNSSPMTDQATPPANDMPADSGDDPWDL